MLNKVYIAESINTIMQCMRKYMPAAVKIVTYILYGTANIKASISAHVIQIVTEFWKITHMGAFDS